MSMVQLVGPAGEVRNFDGSSSQIHVDGLGWTDISIVSRSGGVVMARMQPSIEQLRVRLADDWTRDKLSQHASVNAIAQ